MAIPSLFFIMRVSRILTRLIGTTLPSEEVYHVIHVFIPGFPCLFLFLVFNYACFTTSLMCSFEVFHVYVYFLFLFMRASFSHVGWYCGVVVAPPSLPRRHAPAPLSPKPQTLNPVAVSRADSVCPRGYWQRLACTSPGCGSGANYGLALLPPPYQFLHVKSYSCSCLFLVFNHAWFFSSCWVVLWYRDVVVRKLSSAADSSPGLLHPTPYTLHPSPYT